MRTVSSLLVAIVSTALAGCGSGTMLSFPTSPTPAYLNLNGNWEAIGLPAQPSQGLFTSPIALFMGALQSSNGNVAGTLRAFDLNFLSPCVSLTQDLSASGTLGTNGNLVLTVPISGGTATLTAILSANLQSYTTGSWTIVGGPCAMGSTSMGIMQYAPVTGSYTGTLTNFGSTNNSTFVTAVLTQASTPNADGQFPLTGMITAAGPCAGTFPLISEYVSGNGINPSGNGAVFLPGGFQPYTRLEGPFPPGATSIQASLEIYGLNCSAGSLSGTLTRQ